jgi:hypothetical protein
MNTRVYDKADAQSREAIREHAACEAASLGCKTRAEVDDANRIGRMVMATRNMSSRLKAGDISKTVEMTVERVAVLISARSTS